MLHRALSLAAAVMLTALGASSTANAQGTPLFRVEVALYAVLPLAEPSAVGTQTVVKENSVVLSMPVGLQDTTTVSTAFTLKVAGADWTLPPGTPMIRAARATGGDLHTLPAAAVIYCSGRYSTKSYLKDYFAAGGASAVLADFDPGVRLCAVDTQGDGRFDRGFIDGAVRAPYLKMFPASEAAYVPVKGRPITGASLEIYYQGTVSFVRPYLRLRFNGPYGDDASGTFRFPDNAPPAGVKETYTMRKAREASTPDFSNGSLPNPKVLPYTVTVGNAKVTVHSIDRAAKSAVISIDRDPTFFPFSFQLTPQTIYIVV